MLDIKEYNLGVGCRPNEKLILQILRSIQHASKAQLARLTGLTAVAVGGLMKSLEDKGLVETVGKLQGDMGQPATLYSLSSSGAFGLGISINRGHFETVLLNFVGDVVVSHKHEAVLSAPMKVLSVVLDDIEKILQGECEELKRRVVGVGLALPSNIGSRDQEVERWQSWSQSDFSERLGDILGVPVITQNDVNAAAMAEYAYGSSLSSDSFVYIYFGGAMVHSLGSAFIFNGSCWSGATGNAGDIGLVPMPGSINENGNTFADVCSLHSLVQYFRGKGLKVINHADLLSLIEREAAVFDSWVGDWLNSFQRFIVTLQAMLDLPEIVIDCEDVVEPVIDYLVDALRRQVQSGDREWMHIPKITKGTFAGHASAVGAASLPLEASFSSKL